MRLTQPTDFDILTALSSGNRNVAANIAREIDRDRAYINTRLPKLYDQGLLEKIGPAENSGLYEITPSGRRALVHRDQYGSEEFEALVRGEMKGVR